MSGSHHSHKGPLYEYAFSLGRYKDSEKTLKGTVKYYENKSSVVMSRKELYNHVWEKPVSHFAKENGLNCGRLLCTLKENDIESAFSETFSILARAEELVLREIVFDE